MAAPAPAAGGDEPACDLLIRNACLLDGDGPLDVGIAGGRIAALGAVRRPEAALRTIDARGGLLTPSFVEPHFHLDKVLSRGHFGAVDFREAFAKAHEVKKRFTAADVERRAVAALRLAVAHGIGRMRAQVDVDFATRLVSFEGVMRARERFAGAIEVQPVAFPQEGIVTDPEAPALLREAVRMGATVIGGLPEFERSVEDQQRHIDTIFDIAEETGAEIDMHCDYTDRAAFKTLAMLAETKLRRRFEGRVVAGHCNALALYGADEARRIIERVREAGIAIVVLPVANLQMLGGEGRTPVNRGSSRVLELLDAGVEVAAGADNMFDIWFRFNRMDPVEVGYITCLGAGMRTDAEVRTAFEMVTTRAARAIGAPCRGLAVGEPADLVLFEAASLVDLFRNLPGRRVHVKAGRVVGGLEGSHWSAV